MASTQSQEAIASIHDELATMLKKDKLSEDSDTDSVRTDSEMEEDFSDSKPKRRKSSRKTKTTEKSKISGKKRTRGDEEISKLEKKLTSPKKQNSEKDSSQGDFGGSSSLEAPPSPPPTMERTKSLEAIQKFQPAQIYKASLEKTKVLLQSEDKDYKKIKYWLKIALTAAKSTNGVDQFNEMLHNLRASYSWDRELRETLDSAFPIESS